MRCARRRPGCLRPGPLESPDAPELLPAESPRPVGAGGRVRSPGASGWRRAGQRCRRRTAVLPRRLERGRSTPGPVGSPRRRPATGQERWDPGRRGPQRHRRQERRHQWAQWGSGTRPRIGQEHWSDGSCPAGRHTGRRPEDRTAAGRCPQRWRPTVGSPEVRRTSVWRGPIGPTPRRRRTREDRGRDRPTDPADPPDRRAPTTASQGRRLGQRRPPRRPPGQPA